MLEETGNAARPAGARERRGCRYTLHAMGMDFFEFRETVTRKRAASPPAPAGVPAAVGQAPRPLSVSEVTARIDSAPSAGMPGTLLVQGEVSNYKGRHVSGHVYFTLKDARSCIDCVMFKSDATRLKFLPADGMELIASGRVGVYGQRGKYQLYVGTLRPVGQGALELAFQQLRAKLEAQGLFSPQRKRPLPRFPLRLLLVTSREAAALQDMLKVLRRFPWLRILLYPVAVQGDGAARNVAAAPGALQCRHRLHWWRGPHPAGAGRRIARRPVGL